MWPLGARVYTEHEGPPGLQDQNQVFKPKGPLPHVCPYPSVVPDIRATGNGKSRERGIQSPWDYHILLSSSPHISVVNGLGYWGGVSGGGGVLREMK